MTDIIRKPTYADLERVLLAIDDGYRDDTKYWLRFLRARRLSISIQAITKYEQFLEDEGYSVATINKRLIAVKNRIMYLFEHSTEFSDITKNYKLEKALKKIKLRKKASRTIQTSKIISPEEKDILVDHANPRLKLIIQFLWNSGIRISEMCGIRLDDIRTEKGVAYVRLLGKGKKERAIRIESVLVYRIIKQFKSRKFLFETKSGRRYTRDYPSNLIKELARVFLGREISAHTFRHSFATEKIRETKKIKAVSEYLGHSTTAITLDMYVHEDLSNMELGV
jgi:integrase/recombinase XerD